MNGYVNIIKKSEKPSEQYPDKVMNSRGILHITTDTIVQNGMGGWSIQSLKRALQPNPGTYNFVEVSGNNLESSQAEDFVWFIFKFSSFLLTVYGK